MRAGILTSIIGWLLLVLYPLIRTLMASVAFAMNRRGASKSLERWIRFWIFALAVKIVEVIIPMQLVYWVVKYFIIVSLVTTWSTDILPTASKVMLWMINEAPKLSDRVRADVTNVLDGLRDGVESYAAGAEININTASSPAPTTSSATVITPMPAISTATPLQIHSTAHDATGTFAAAVEARRRQLEVELAALAVIQERASSGDAAMRLPEVPVD